MDSSFPKDPSAQLALSAPSTLPLLLFPYPPFPWRGKWAALTLHVTCVCATPVLQGHYNSFCHFILLYVIYLRFVGEKKVPQKKVLSWKRQRMPESRCRSRNMNSLSLEISTTTCGGPLPLGSGTPRSRCVSLYSEIIITPKTLA